MRKFKARIKYDEKDRYFLSIPVFMSDSPDAYEDAVSFVKSNYPDMYLFELIEIED